MVIVWLEKTINGGNMVLTPRESPQPDGRLDWWARAIDGSVWLGVAKCG